MIWCFRFVEMLCRDFICDYQTLNTMKPKKSSNPGRKRKSNVKASMSHMDKCSFVLKEVGAELHQMLHKKGQIILMQCTMIVSRNSIHKCIHK